MRDELAEAVRCQQQGRLREAALACQAILAREPRHAEAMHLLGVLALQFGDPRSAAALIGRAIAVSPRSAAFHANLGEAFRRGGDLERAAQACRTALDLQPEYPEAANNLGLILLAHGDAAGAIEQFRAALRSQPKNALVHNNLGHALRAAGKSDEAVAAFREAVTVDPACAEAHSNLGQLLLERHRRRAALRHCQEAVRLRPDLPEAHNNLGNALRALDRFEEARASYTEALRLQPDLALTYNNMAQTLQEEGDLQGAFAWYQQALDRDSSIPRIHANLASAFEERGDFERAEERYHLALRLDPQFAEAHNGLGFTLHQQGKLPAALAAYREVIRLRPTFAPGHSNLAFLLEELGDLAEAEAAYRQALQLDRGLAGAHAQLATLLRGRLPDDDLAALRRALARPHLGLVKRLVLHFGLAHVLDGRRDYAAAGDHLRQGNALCQELWKRQGQSYDPKVHTAFVDQLLAAFAPAFFERTRDFGIDSDRPVFIVGLPRSGTTLTEQILASHPQVFGAGELNYAKADLDALPALVRADAPVVECLARLRPEMVQQLAWWHLARLRGLNDTAPRIVDKMPDNYLYLGLLAVLFPRARVIHCRRDLRDIAVSCWMTNFRHIRWAADLDHIAARFRDYRRLMDHWRQTLPGAIHEVDYEETVADLEGTARKLLDWCGLPWDPACLAFHETQRPVRTASVTQVRQPIYSGSVARWKHYEADLKPLLVELESMI